MGYNVWSIPTEEGKRAFGWKTHKLAGPFDNKDDADEYAYIKDADEPAPDKNDYRRIKVLPADEMPE